MTSAIPTGGFGESLVPPRAISREIRQRLSKYLLKTVTRSAIEAYEQDGWTVDKPLRRSVRMRKPKSHEVAFRDQVWATFAKLRFDRMNRGDGIELDVGASEEQRVDVFAGDDEVILIIKCVSSETSADDYPKARGAVGH